ncbi:MAG: HEAT repeat domain-containing protein [Candidatus Rifleibacteriota bacterium]
MYDIYEDTNLPEKLDLNAWIQFCLNSSSVVDRQIALEELVATGIPPYLVARIREIAAQDESESCRELAAWVVKVDRARSDLKPRMRKLELSPVNILMLLEESENAGATVITQLLRKAPAKEILKLWRSGLPTEQNPRLIEVGLTVLAKFGNAEDTELVLEFLKHDDVQVQCAALTFLQVQNSEIFKKIVSQGLASNKFKLQLHSVHLLRTVDPEETLKYIQAFLFNKNPIIRQRALRELMLLPFELVQNLFLQFLSREMQPLLLVKAGFVVAFNPSPDIPLKVYDIFQFTQGGKKHILQLILKQLVASIQSSGVLEQSFEEYMSSLKEKISLKRSEMIIRCAVRDLSSPDRNMRISALERLAPYNNHESIQKVLQKFYASEKDEEIKGLLANLLQKDGQQEKISFSLPESVEDFLELKVKQQRELLRHVNSSAMWHEYRPFLHELLQYPMKKRILLELLNLFGKFGSKIDSPAITPFLKSDDPSVTAAAVKNLGLIDIDVVLPNLNQFLADDDPRIKAAALEVYVKADKEGALQYLSSILKSTVSATRRIGLSLLPQIDYPSAEPLLWNFLKYEGVAELKIQAAYMVASNPTQEGLYKLFAVSHKKDGEIKKGYEELWEVALISAKELFELSPEDIEKKCWEVFKADQEETQVEKPGYSYSEVIGNQEEDQSNAEKEVEFSEQLFIHLNEFKQLYIAGAAIIILFVIFVMSDSSGEKTSYKNYKKKTDEVKGADFVRSEEDVTTQFGGPNWDGTLKSNAVDILSGGNYSRAIAEGDRELKNFRSEVKARRHQFLLDIYNNQGLDPMMRMSAAAKLNDNFTGGEDNFRQGDYTAAEYNFTRVIEDPQANALAKVMACQYLAQIAQKKGRKEDFTRWMDKLGEELQNISEMKGFENLKNFSSNFTQFLNVSRAAADDSNSDQILKSFTGSGLTQGEARERLQAIKETQNQFERQFDGRH